MTTEAFINAEILKWARERDHLTPDSAAKRLKVARSRLEAWESGARQPTFRQAQDIAKKLKIPFGYLFLSSAPPDVLLLPDLSTVGDEPPARPSPELADVLSDALAKQDWFREYLEAEEAQPITFIGKFSLQDSPTTIASDIRKTLSIDYAMRREAASWEEFLRILISKAESAGVLVLRNGVVDNNTHRDLSVEEFRGFAISDDLAPVVFVNGKDAKAAQIFTLAHELAHLWIGSSGVSNPDYRRTSAEQSNDIERLCNRAAAETLIPTEQFLSSWDIGGTIENNVESLRRHFRVSSMVVLRQAYDLGQIETAEYWDVYDDLRERWLTSKPKRGSGGDFYATLLTRSSNTFTRSLIAALVVGQVLHRDAARLLNVRVGTLDGIAKNLFGTEFSA